MRPAVVSIFIRLPQRQTMKNELARVLNTAQKMLDGSLGIVEGSRILADLRHRVADDERDPDFLPFVAIDSETDHLPVGEAKHHWSETALSEKEEEIQEVEEFYRDEALSACRRLVKRFEGAA